MSEKKILYQCDPNKNTECSKEICFARYPYDSDVCYLTDKKEFAKDGTRGCTDEEMKGMAEKTALVGTKAVKKKHNDIVQIVALIIAILAFIASFWPH